MRLSARSLHSPFEPPVVARQSTNIGVCESALVEATLPFRNRGCPCTVWTAHRSSTNTAVVRQVPERRHRECRRCRRPPVLGKSSNLEISVLYTPYQSRLRKCSAIQARGLLLGVLIEHLPAAHRGPPDDHAVALGEYIFRENFGGGWARERTHQRLEKSKRKRLGRFECWWGVFVECYLVPGDKAALTVSIDQ